jgi:hypothetical protein
MVSNDIVMPLVLQRRDAFISGRYSVGWLLLTVRRISIFVILFLAYIYYRMAGDAQLASIGLLSFAAIAQLAPAFFGGLIWRRATARGALAGMTVGILIWTYTLLLPSFADAGIVGGHRQRGPWSSPGCGRRRCSGSTCRARAWRAVVLAQHPRLCGFSSRAPASIERCRPTCCPSELAPIAPSFALALLGDDRGTDHDGCALSWRGARAYFVRQLCLDTRDHSIRRAKPASSSCAMPAPARLTIGRLSRLVLSLLCASARLHQSGAEASSTTPVPRSTQPRILQAALDPCGKASPCSTRTCS